MQFTNLDYLVGESAKASTQAEEISDDYDEEFGDDGLNAMFTQVALTSKYYEKEEKKPEPKKKEKV